MGFRQLMARVLIAATVAISLADEVRAQTAPMPALNQGVTRWVSDNMQESAAGDTEQLPDATPSNDSNNNQRNQSRFDEAVVARGRSAFDDSCTQCHDAERSLQKRKSLSGWLATVRRMARMDDADISSSDIVPIATYLASLNPAAQATGGNGNGGGNGDAAGAADAAAEESEAGANLSATISTLTRNGNDNFENPDFFVDAWVRADFQTSGPLRARVTACTSCHSDQTQDGGFTFELVEATAHYDLLHHKKDRKHHQMKFHGHHGYHGHYGHHGHHHRWDDFDAEIKAGRFIVPFGAFAAMSHPGVYRTVTNPLLYNMGRQVNPDRTRPPVLPMPYSDEGVDLNARIPLFGDVNATIDVYAVNGLQGGPAGIDFTSSRSYTDNNKDPAVGGRATVGTSKFRFGGSVMSGRFQDDMAMPLGFHLSGGDFTARLFDNHVRLYFEYALRRNDTIFQVENISYGTVSEMEILLWSKPNISGVLRYDNLEHRDMVLNTSVERFTWGINSTVLGGSLLIVNHERWRFSTGLPDVDVFGIRWVATF